MTGPVWTKIRELDKERQQIQNRIIDRARKHHAGIKLTPEEGRHAWADAVRYIEIEDQQWALLGVKKPAGDDNFPN